ncbi:MAG: hypothetical protein IIT65_09325 [Lachnospiraceae bacterium]|nr:hypothetical protein [Lachnospiraceae bacterium]
MYYLFIKLLKPIAPITQIGVDITLRFDNTDVCFVSFNAGIDDRERLVEHLNPTDHYKENINRFLTIPHECDFYTRCLKIPNKVAGKVEHEMLQMKKWALIRSKCLNSGNVDLYIELLYKIEKGLNSFIINAVAYEDDKEVKETPVSVTSSKEDSLFHKTWILFNRFGISVSFFVAK